MASTHRTYHLFSVVQVENTLYIDISFKEDVWNLIIHQELKVKIKRKRLSQTVIWDYKICKHPIFPFFNFTSFYYYQKTKLKTKQQLDFLQQSLLY